VKKKVILSEKDKKDWINFTKEIENIKNKDIDLFKNTKILRKIPKLDLHGLSLQKANEEVNKFINKSFFSGYRKILIITGKGTRSKARNNPLATIMSRGSDGEPVEFDQQLIIIA